MPLRQLDTDLFLFNDSCNVYIIRRGEHAVAIDFGTGAVLDYLDEIGVEKLDWIIHTHHHRDQCSGDRLAVAQGTKIAVPEWEAHYFLEAEHFWGRRSMFHLYDMRGNFNTLRESVPVHAFLQDFTAFTWQDVQLEIAPAPGHTRGQIALVWLREEAPVAFVGDMIHGKGHTLTLYDLQNAYGQWQGMYQTTASLGYLQTFSPSVLYPSHGTPVIDPPRATQHLKQAMTEWLKFYRATPIIADDVTKSDIVEVVPGIYHLSHTNASQWVLLSRSGGALFVDCGANHDVGLERTFNMPDESDRYIPHSLNELAALGMKSIDVVIPTHCHDDHTPGLAYLHRKHRTQIWCLENMAEIFEHPTAQILGCTVPRPLPVDRMLKDGQEVEWEEFSFVVRHTPGHALHHLSLFLEHEGHRIAFTGDTIFRRNDRDEFGRKKPAWNLIPMNRVRAADHLRTAEILLDNEPDIICPGHGPAFRVTLDDLEEYRDCVAQIPRKLDAIVGKGKTDSALDFHWIHVYPYEQAIEAGVPFDVEVRFTNHEKWEVDCVLRPVMPSGWSAEPAERSFICESGGESSATFTITPAEHPDGHPAKVPFAFELILNGRSLGEACHGIGNYIRYPYHEPPR